MTTICRFDAAFGGVHHRLRRLAFASCFVYSPGGAGSECERSRVLRELLKVGETRLLLYYADRVRREAFLNPRLAEFLSGDSVLIPVPGSAPTDGDGRGRLTAERIAAALIAAGLGSKLWRGLQRVSRVRKSATASPGMRPSVADHFRSFAIASDAAEPPARVMLVDDVVTKGRTLLAAAARLRETFPDTEIRAFALLRTLGLGQPVERLLEPCIGEIIWRAGDASRTP